MKYYAYYRVSTETQAEKNGTEMQIAVVEKYCADNGITLSGTFSDEGVSGTKEMREGLYDLLATLERGDRVVVQNTSRLWRDQFVAAFVKKELMRVGADVISVEQPTYTVSFKDPNDFLFNSIFEILDQYDRMQIAMKLAKGRRARAKSGNKPCGTAPYGYKWHGNDIVIDYNNHITVLKVFELCFSYNGNLSAVKRYLDANGYRTARGNEFSVQALKNILTNDFYIGVVTHAGVKTQGVHETFVDTDLFNEVQRLLQKKGRK